MLRSASLGHVLLVERATLSVGSVADLSKSTLLLRLRPVNDLA